MEQTMEHPISILRKSSSPSQNRHKTGQNKNLWNKSMERNFPIIGKLGFFKMGNMHKTHFNMNQRTYCNCYGL